MPTLSWFWDALKINAVTVLDWDQFWLQCA